MKKLLIVALCVLAASGCVNYTSVTEIEPDGSGSLSILVEVPQIEDASVSVTDFEIPDSVQGWEMTLMSADTSDTAIVYRLEGAFTSPEVLSQVFDIDNITFEKEETGDLIRYHLSMLPFYMPATRFEGYFGSTATLLKAVIKHGTDKHYWTEKLVLPGKVVKHNASKIKGDTLIWKVDIADLADEGFPVDAVWEVSR
ncbi:hypothetical protein JXM67_03105 [candidate division WOR-3 bacterium]|nr:hypothetical protein [candidate division WOR-3 bacterium]